MSKSTKGRFLFAIRVLDETEVSKVCGGEVCLHDMPTVSGPDGNIQVDDSRDVGPGCPSPTPVVTIV